MAMRAIAVTLVGLALSVVQAVAEPSYPSRPVRIIVPSEAGGGTDISARVLSDRLAQSTGKQFYIENRPGAAGMLGIEIAARAPNDGYTLLIAASTITIVPSTNSNVKYDILRDFVPISQLINSPSVLLVNPGLPTNRSRTSSPPRKPSRENSVTLPPASAVNPTWRWSCSVSWLTLVFSTFPTRASRRL